MTSFFVPREGIEPSWNYFHTSLSRARLPIPPPRRQPLNYSTNDLIVKPETKSQGLFHQIQKEVTFCGLPHGADA